MSNFDILKDLMESGQDKGTSAYDTTAEVRRVDGDTAWVHIPGGVDETPVKLTISAKPGDTVQLRVGGGSAWLVGNQTAPPTDDTKANKAQETAKKAAGTATDYVADTNNGIFVHPKDNTEDGVQIRDKISILRSGESVAEYGDIVRIGKTGSAHLLVKNDAVDIIRSGVSVAEYGAAARIGKEDSAHFLIQDGKISGYGNTTGVYFETGNGGSTALNTYIGDGSTKYFDVLNATSLTSVKVDGTTVSATLINASMVELATAPADGAKIVITYETSVSAPYFTFGTRATGTVGIGSSTFGSHNKAQGIYATAEGEDTAANGFASHAEGTQNEANGAHSHAEGNGCEANGEDSHAGGNLSVANGQYSFAHGQNTKTTMKGAMACGRYNYPHAVLFGVGNGTANPDSSRKNAFSVGETGNCFVGGRLMSGTPSLQASDYRPMFLVKEFSEDNLTVSAGGNIGTRTPSIAVAGYTPIAVATKQIMNATSEGKNANYCYLYACTLNGNVLAYNGRNTGSSTAKIKTIFKVFYIATAAIDGAQ